MFPGILYENPREDKWYLYKGVAPPERQSHGVTEDNIEQIIKDHSEHAHIWRQKGNYIFCRAGHLEHGNNIGVFQRLVGTDENGRPILRKI